jgi:hypothetical protein
LLKLGEFRHFLFGGPTRHLFHQRGRGVRRREQRRHAVGIGGKQLSLPAVRPLEQFAVRETADQPGVNDASPPHAWNVARVGADPVEVPDRFAGLRLVVDEKPAAILAKIPVKPQGESGRWPISRRSTTIRSPGSPPSTPNGPLN